MQVQLSETQKKLLFWASFLSLTAAGFGFVFRVMTMGDWVTEWGVQYDFDFKAAGNIFGASLWPIAVTMILFSLIVDKIGYKISMVFAFLLQAASGYLTFTCTNPDTLWWACFCGGLGHGIVEAVINPVCAAVYPKAKTKMLTILHASWPAGLVLGGVLILLFPDLPWRTHALWILIPVAVYGLMYLPCKFPVDERVAANVPYRDMLKEVGFLGAFLAAFLLFYELFRVVTGSEPSWLLWAALGVGVAVGAGFGAYVKAVGKPLFFFMCVLMIPLATTELGTDAWIRELMAPVLKKSYALDAGWAIVASAFIMMILRFFAGPILKHFSPPMVLTISSLFSMLGLIVLSGSSGMIIFGAFVLYAVGQTFYWPTMLGFVSERYPRGGALTLNSVSAIGLLSVGIIGAPVMGVFYDNHLSDGVKELSEVGYNNSKNNKAFFGMPYETVGKELARDVILGDSTGKSLKAVEVKAPEDGQAASANDTLIARTIATQGAKASALATAALEPDITAVSGAPGTDDEKKAALAGALMGARTGQLDALMHEVMVLAKALGDTEAAAGAVKDEIDGLARNAKIIGDDAYSATVKKAVDAVKKEMDAKNFSTVALAGAVNASGDVAAGLDHAEAKTLAGLIVAAKTVPDTKTEADKPKEKTDAEKLADAAGAAASSTIAKIVADASPDADVLAKVDTNAVGFATAMHKAVSAANTGFDDKVDAAGRASLKTTALAFPLSMGVCFLLITLYFRARGGYQQIHLVREGEEAERAEEAAEHAAEASME